MQKMICFQATAGMRKLQYADFAMIC
jgi:hypothetical protein